MCVIAPNRIAAGALALAMSWLAAAAEELPQTLADTGLYADAETQRLAPGVIGYTPQYALWSDGARKQRWLALPDGQPIDASDPDQWVFPPGTRLWKQFGYSRPVETRFIERRPDGSWRYATYVWDDDGREARLAPAAGIAAHPVAEAPQGRYEILTREDCRACHEGRLVPVLGIGTLQLSRDRDPMAVHAETRRADDADVSTMVRGGQVVNLPSEYDEHPARIVADSAQGRAALGYLHANCGHCHSGEVDLGGSDMLLAQRARPSASANVLGSLLGRRSEFALAGMEHRIVAGDPSRSVLLHRMRSRNAVLQMPPLGTRLVDHEAIALVEQWIANLPLSTETMQ